VIEGEALLQIEGREHRAGPGTLITIPAGANHHVENPGSTPLFFLTVYAPPEYRAPSAACRRSGGGARAGTRVAGSPTAAAGDRTTPSRSSP